MIQLTTRRAQRGPQKTLPPNIFRTVPGFGLARGSSKLTVKTCIIRVRGPSNSGGSKGAARCANSPLRASRVADGAQERSGRRIFQIDWKANPPIRRFGEKRKDQPEKPQAARESSSELKK